MSRRKKKKGAQAPQKRGKMGLTIPVVEKCPYAKGSTGIIEIPPLILARLAGAVRTERNIEWGVWLLGRREEDGWRVVINGYYVPPNQRRGATSVVFPEEELRDDVVGVLHSHHSMGTVPSGTDRNDINTRAAVSVIISSNQYTDEAKWLGFAYSAVGKVDLPCGSLGEVKFKIMPWGVDDWPLKWVVEKKAEGTDLGDCDSLHKVEEGFYQEISQPTCGLGEAERRLRLDVFGATNEIVTALPAPTYNYYGQGYKSYTSDDYKNYNKDYATKPYAKDNDPKAQESHSGGSSGTSSGGSSGKTLGPSPLMPYDGLDDSYDDAYGYDADNPERFNSTQVKDFEWEKRADGKHTLRRIQVIADGQRVTQEFDRESQQWLRVTDESTAVTEEANILAEASAVADAILAADEEKRDMRLFLVERGH